MLTISGFFALVTTYLIQIYIGKNGGLEQVGFYNAGFTLLKFVCRNNFYGYEYRLFSKDCFD